MQNEPYTCDHPTQPREKCSICAAKEQDRNRRHEIAIEKAMRDDIFAKVRCDIWMEGYWVGVCAELNHDMGPLEHEWHKGAYERHAAESVRQEITASSLGPAHISHPRKIPCPGCDGHECDDGCNYPGALSPIFQMRQGDR